MQMSRHGGFTLVELIISLVIVSVIMVGLLTAMRSFGITDEKLEKRLSQADERRVVSAFLEDVLGQAMLKPRLAMVGKPEESSFVGAPDSLEWIGVMPARHGAGGLHHFRLYWAGDGRSAALMLAYLPFAGLEVLPDWNLAERRVLVEDVSGFALRYQLEDGGEWLGQWRSTVDSRQVGRVGVALAAGGAEWPLLVVPVRSLVNPGAMGRIVNGP
ncbi:prepilin-type N-terminal cleavage/methylation domain-containing protein [Zoogloea sp.]|uniref:prepilin-type N-terminal cleavage/methylation domain-containing protein n=1 Tax=Zoogloea sp. TaxID=49181 RepID=UPI0014158E2A|nr:MAG: prepilin-type N-terminal cleavage/methylation domain-containing protein [Zoogloea sp.]